MGILSLYSDPLGKKYKKRSWSQALGITRAKRAVLRKVLGPFRPLNPFRRWRNFKNRVKNKLGMRSEFAKAYRHGTWGKYVKRKLLGESLRENFEHYQSDPHDGVQKGPTNKGIFGKLSRYAAPGAVVGLALLGKSKLKRVYDAVKAAHNPTRAQKIVNTVARHASDVADSAHVVGKGAFDFVKSGAHSLYNATASRYGKKLRKKGRKVADSFVGKASKLASGFVSSFTGGKKAVKKAKKAAKKAAKDTLQNSLSMPFSASRLLENYGAYPQYQKAPRRSGGLIDAVTTAAKIGLVGAAGVVGAAKFNQAREFIANTQAIAKASVKNNIISKAISLKKKEAGDIGGLGLLIPGLKASINKAKIDSAMAMNALFHGGDVGKHLKKARGSIYEKMMHGRVKGAKLLTKKQAKQLKSLRKSNPLAYETAIARGRKHFVRKGKVAYGVSHLKKVLRAGNENLRKHDADFYKRAKALRDEGMIRKKRMRKVKAFWKASPLHPDNKQEKKESMSMPFSGSRLLESISSSAASHLSHGVEHLNHPVKALLLKHGLDLGEDVLTSKLSDKNKKRVRSISHPKAPKSRLGKLVADLVELGGTTGGMALASKLKNPHLAKTLAAGIASNVAGEVVGSKIGRKIDTRRLRNAKRLARSTAGK